MILAATYPQQRIGITNNFFYSPIKRRLIMLTKNQNPRMNYISRLLVLPLAVIVFAAFAVKAKTINDPKISNTAAQITGFLTGNSYPETEITHKQEPTDNIKIFSTKRKIRVVLDAGHGGRDAGSRAEDGTAEKDLTLQLIKKIKALNTNPNVEIILTREDDIYQSPKEKVAFANEQIPDLFVSIHIDAAMKKEAEIKTGMTVWVARDSFENVSSSKLFASAIIGRFKNNYGLDVPEFPMQRAVGITVLQSLKVPSVLIEAGYITNNKDRDYLTSAIGQEKFAINVLNALNDFSAGAYTVVRKNEINDSLKKGFAVRIEKENASEISDASQAWGSKKSDLSLRNLPNALIIMIDGRRSDKIALSKITPDQIKSVAVLKGKEAEKKYGAGATDGAIEIITTEAKKLDLAQLSEEAGQQVVSHDEKQSEFPGGMLAFRSFLEKNLNANVPVSEGWKPGMYTVMLKFVINAKGELTSIETENYKGTKTAEECIRLMKTSPKWLPAMQNGKTLSSYKRQPITFFIEEEKDVKKPANL